MGLEEIEGIEKAKKLMENLKELTEAREICMPDALKAISDIKTEYDALVKEKGIEYCNKNCPGVLTLIKNMYSEFNGYSDK
jgi:hypothetical protein